MWYYKVPHYFKEYMHIVINPVKSSTECKYCFANNFSHKIQYYELHGGYSKIPLPLHVCNECNAYHYDNHDVTIETVLINTFAKWRKKF